jgi:hypothetical protein
LVDRKTHRDKSPIATRIGLSLDRKYNYT